MQRTMRLLLLALSIVGCVGWFRERLKKDCNGTSYFTDMKVCCSNRLFMRYLNDKCCGGLPYNSDESGCCAGLQYNLDLYICCQEKIESRLSRDSCCGALPYDSSKGDCRDGQIYVRHPRKNWKKNSD